MVAQKRQWHELVPPGQKPSVWQHQQRKDVSAAFKAIAIPAAKGLPKHEADAVLRTHLGWIDQAVAKHVADPSKTIREHYVETHQKDQERKKAAAQKTTGRKT